MYPGSVTRLTEKQIASADSIIGDADVLVLTGTTTINTIQPRATQFSNADQIIFLIAKDGSVTLGTSGNIVTGGTILQNRYACLIWSKSLAKWVPPIVA